MDYNPQDVESKWQDRWSKERSWEVSELPGKKKFYMLDMFPYPSGRIHMGHVRNYAISDVIARIKRSMGFYVMHPMGWDAFGLPAENAAIKNKTHPEKWTLENIQTMKAQLMRLGFGYDWSREVTTCLPEYYRFEQGFFVDFFEKGLAYRKASTVNWCPSCQTVLANEQVEDGHCWRCDSETTTRELEQWFFKTTAYAEELLKGLDQLPGYPERIKTAQRHWIGKSEGAEIEFAIEGRSETIRVFTTRPDTLFGVSYMALAPEHALALELSKTRQTEVTEFIERCRKMDRFKRTADDTPKEGVFTGSHALHPLTGERIPIYLANFVLLDYGTGALMAVPAHDHRDHAFAKKYGLPIRQVIAPTDGGKLETSIAPFVEPGVLIASGPYTNLISEKAKREITLALEKLKKGRAAVQYRLRDWGLSRQRYWGAPIPIVHCQDCGPVAVPKSELPVVLPGDVDLSGEGISPLAKHPFFAKTTCPKCRRKDARRETDTMDTFMESSWYYLRYTSPHSKNEPFDKKALSYWLGVDQYIGGIEHATMHLLYYRFFHKVLRDLGYFPSDLDPRDRDEPVRNLFNQGIVYKDGAKMSKSKGNVVDPMDLIAHYGCDTARMFSLFAAPPDKILEWSEQGVEGSFRFLGRVWRLVDQNSDALKSAPRKPATAHDKLAPAAKKLRTKTHATVLKYHTDFENSFQFNTMIAAIMELVNEAYLFQAADNKTPDDRAVFRESVETTIRLLYPFAPHIAEELAERIGFEARLLDAPLPVADAQALVKTTALYIVQVNGKLRSEVEMPIDASQAEVIAAAQADAKVASKLAEGQLVKTIFVPKKIVNFVVKT